MHTCSISLKSALDKKEYDTSRYPTGGAAMTKHLQPDPIEAGKQFYIQDVEWWLQWDWKRSGWSAVPVDGARLGSQPRVGHLATLEHIG